MKPILQSEAATRDVSATVDHLAKSESTEVALRFVDALERAYGRIARHPSTGSPHLARILDLPGLRSKRFDTFPYVVFYVERADRIDVWRVLHTRRDVAERLLETDEE